MAKSYKKIDWNEVKKIIPEKPDKWKIDPLGKFLKLCDLSGVIQAFRNNGMDGNLFLKISEGDDEWDDLGLNTKDEQALLHYQNELKKYNENFDKETKQPFKNIPVELVQTQWVQEEDPIKKEEDKEDPDATFKRKKPKKNNLVESEEENKDEETIKREKKKPKLVLVKNIKGKAETLTFKKSFPIHRDTNKKSLSESFYIDHKEISRSHAEVHFIPNSGYFFQDVKSSNHSYLKVPDNCNLILSPGMELVMGESLVTIERIDAKKVSLSISLLFENENESEDIDLILEFPSISDEVIFGRNPSKKRTAVCKLTSDIDQKIEAEHAKFIRSDTGEKVTLVPLAKVYIKLGDEEKASDLYLLNKDMEIKLGLGEVNLQILEVYPQRIRTKCACLNNNNFIAFIAFPCKHVFCSGCVNPETSKKCKNCGGEIEKMFQLVDINSI